MVDVTYPEIGPMHEPPSLLAIMKALEVAEARVMRALKERPGNPELLSVLAKVDQAMAECRRLDDVLTDYDE